MENVFLNVSVQFLNIWMGEGAQNVLYQKLWSSEFKWNTTMIFCRISSEMPLYEANSRGGHQCLNPKSRCQNLRFQHKGLVTRNMKCKSPITYHSKDMANVEKILESGSNFKVKVTKSKVMVPLESSCHKEYKYEIWKPYHLPFKRYGQC